MTDGTGLIAVELRADSARLKAAVTEIKKCIEASEKRLEASLKDLRRTLESVSNQSTGNRELITREGVAKFIADAVASRGKSVIAEAVKEGVLSAFDVLDELSRETVNRHAPEYNPLPALPTTAAGLDKAKTLVELLQRELEFAHSDARKENLRRQIRFVGSEATRIRTTLGGSANLEAATRILAEPFFKDLNSTVEALNKTFGESEEKVRRFSEKLEWILLPDRSAASDQRSGPDGGGGQGRLAGGTGSDRIGVDVASLGGAGFAGYATPIFPVPLAEQGDWRSGMLQALTGQTEAFRQAQEVLAPVVAEADAALARQGATFERLRAQGALTEEVLGRVSRRLIEQVGALLRNADSWDDWALGVLGSLETVLRAAIGGSGKDRGSLAGTFRWLEELLGLGGDVGGLMPGTPGSAAIGPLSTAFGFAGGGVPAVGVPALVGERGPELVVPKLPMRIIDHARTRALLDGDGGGEAEGGITLVQNITINGRLTAAERAETLAQARAMGRAAVDEFRRSINRGGPDARLVRRR